MTDLPDDRSVDTGVPDRVERVSQEALRRRFNDAGIGERAQAGALVVRVLEERPVPPLAVPEPDGTMSQRVEFAETLDGPAIAMAHCYRRPDGSLGASGRYDPKRLVLDGVVYKLERKRRVGE